MQQSLLAALSAVSLAVGAHHAPAHVTTKTVSKPKKEPTPVVAVVKPGDSLYKIAAQYKTSYVRLFDANAQIKDPGVITPGEKIRIPGTHDQLPDRPLPTVPLVETAAAPAQTAPIAQSAPVSGCGDNFYANFIYSHESGCQTTAMSSNGCYGIGQACPASKIYYCGSDYACQNAYFTAYASKYGGWAGAYDFWVAHGWW